MKYLMILFLGIILFSPIKLFANEDTEKSLIAENKMLKSTIDNLREEIAKLQAELKKTKPPVIPSTKPADVVKVSIATQPIFPKESVLRIVSRYDEINRSPSKTKVQKDVAYSAFQNEMKTIMSTNFVVDDVSWKDGVASLLLGGGNIDKAIRIEDWAPKILIMIKIDQSGASSIKKGNPVVMTGTISISTRSEAQKQTFYWEV